MKRIKVRKTLGYDPTCGGRFSRYEGYDRIALGLEDPGILAGQKKLVTGDVRVLCSPRKRARDSVMGGKVETTHLLDEVMFDLSELVGEEEYVRCGSNLVRRRFVKAFENDELGEKRVEVKTRMERLLRRLKKEPGEVLLVSHSFFMKILEIYLSHKKLFERPKILREYFNTDKKTYNFGEGFDFEL